MSQTIAYLRTSTDKQDLGNQKLEILEWARKKDLKIDEFVQITMSSRKTRKQRRIEEVLQSCCSPGQERFSHILIPCILLFKGYTKMSIYWLYPLALRPLQLQNGNARQHTHAAEYLPDVQPLV